MSHVVRHGSQPHPCLHLPLAFVVGCPAESRELAVDLQTDFVPPVSAQETRDRGDA
jgi:hypothetical protein